MDTLTLARSFASLLLDTAAKGTVLLLLACLAAWLCRRSSAALRHSIWCMTMGGLLVLPVASWALPAWQIPILPPEPLPAPVAEAVRLPTPPVAEVVRLPASPQILAPSGRSNSPVLSPPTMEATASVHPDTAVPERPPVAPSFIEPVPAPVPVIVESVSPPWTTIEWTSLLVSVGWLLGVSLFGMLLLVGLWRTVKLRRTSLTVADGEWPGMLVELRQRLGLSRSVELREHAESVVPLTWGIWRPVVLLPKLARAWDEPMRRAVLLHELAHVQRGDVACQVLGRLTCVLFWFHPLAWFALRQLRQEREQACDDAVVGTGEKASDYAEQLLQVARLCCAPRGLSLGVAMAEGSSLETRVKSLFDSARSHGPLTRRVAISLFVIGGAILAGLAPIEPTAAEPVEVVSTLQRAFEATVDIHTTKGSGPPRGGTSVNGMGTGFIVDSQGYIVTANHVVSGTTTIQVTLHDGTELPGTVVGTDPVADLAVIRIHHSKPLAVMPEQHQQTLKVSDEVTAIGNAFGWKHTVSRGIISGLGRDLELNEEQKYTNLIQMDLSLNPGNSGGPLLNAQGEAIGVNISLRAGGQKIGFAIPIQDAREVFSKLLEQDGVTTHKNLGREIEASHDGAPDSNKVGISLTAAAMQATVDIQTEKPNPRNKTALHSKLDSIIKGVGSGFIVDGSGFVVTAYHVIDGVSSIKVTLSDGTELPASVVGSDPQNHLAVLRIHSPGPLTVMPEQHRLPKIAEPVLAVGNAYGWNHTISRGIVSGLGRDVVLTDQSSYKNLIQTDAAINPGSSGGPLLNAQGEAIGINIAIRNGVQKIGFAIPIQDARKVFVGLMSPIISGPAAKEQLDLLKPVFGEAKRGIQLGLAVGSLERTFAADDRIPLWLFYRNRGDKELTFHLSHDFMNDPPTVTDANGKRVQVNFVMHWMFIAPLKITLQPGEVWCIATPGLYLGNGMPSIKPVAGKYKLTYPQGIWDVKTTQRLNTDIPSLPSGTPDISGLLKADPKQPASNAPVGQMVETPNWSEHLTTGAIEFEIAPGKNGQLEARVLAAEKHASDADTEAQTGKQTPTQPAVAQPKVIELLSRFRESRQRLEPLHVQMRHIEEYTDAFRAHHRIQAERQELVVKAIQKMSTEDFKKANPHLGPGISADYVRLSIKDSYDTNRSFAKMQNQSVSDVELFQKGTAYQIRTRHHSNDQALGSLTFPAEPLTAGNLGTTYKEIGFYSWAPQTSPSGMIVYGSQPEYRQITSKPYHTNGANPIPAFSNFVSTRSHDWHPIDAFFFQPPENYRVIGAETIDGRETVIVEVPVATSYSQGFANEKGESYQLKEVHYHRAWLDPARGSLPVKLLIWHGNEKTNFATHVSQPPRNVMTTQQLTEVVPGGWYPTLTTLDKYDRDEEKMPKAPPSGQGTEWDQYLEDVAKVPFVVYERETWKCELVEVPRTLTDEFFVLPTPAGAKIIDRDREDLIDDYSLGLPVNEFSEVGVFLGKAWLLGPLSVMPDLTKDGGVGEVTPKAPTPVGQTEETSKADANVDLDKVVWWGEAVDGLEPGFWLTKSEDPRNLRIPMDSLVNYRVVVRNTMDKEIEFLVRLLPFDDQDVPYLIPSSQLDPKGKITPPQPAKEFQARGAANVLDSINPAYVITLAAGESALIPGEFGLYVGQAPDERYPQIANFEPGTHWIVQPLRVHPLADTERAELNRLLGEFQVTKIDRDGKTRQEPVVRVGAPDDSKGKPAFAKYHLEVGTLNAAAHRNAEKATWGQIEQGMQCGLRILNPQPSYKIGDTLEGEVLWRNTSQAVITTTLPRQLDLYPSIDDSQGQHRSINFGARFELLPPTHDYQPGEVRSLGVVKVTLVAEGTPGPKTNQEPGQITLEQGQYKLKASGGVGNISPWSGELAFTVAATLAAATPEPTTSPRSLRGQIIDEEKLGVPNAEVLIVGGTDWNRPLEGQLIAQGVTNEKGEFAIPIPESELAKKPWGQVWRRAPGFAAARGNSVQSLESLMEKPLTYGPLVRTEGLHLVVHDPSGKPRPGVRAEALSVRVNQGIGYPLPAVWRNDNSGISDAEGRVHLPYIDPGSVDRLELTPEGHTSATQFERSYFLNYRPQAEAPHFIFPTFETGSIEGQLVAGPGVTVPKGLKIPMKCLTGKVGVSGVYEVTVDDDGRFRVPNMPAGEISVLKFLDDAQPLRPWISKRAYVKAGETTKLEIPIVTGTRVTGRVQKSDTKAGVADYEFEVYYGPAIKFRGSNLWLMTQPVKSDAEGRFELFLPPGPINLRLTRYVDGYSDATSWLPREKRGGLGPLHEIPSEAEFELPVIDLVKMLPVQGTLVDQNNKPLSDGVSWNVDGFPEIPGEEEGFVMNSMAGVHTDTEGRFEGSYPEPYPPVRWKASHRVWKTKYEFDDITYRAEVVQKTPLILRVDTTKPLED